MGGILVGRITIIPQRIGVVSINFKLTETELNKGGVMSIIQRTGYNKNRRVKIDYQGSKKKNLTQEKMEMQTHIISYIKSGTSNNKQIYWFESNIAGRIYILADKKLFNLGFYDKNYKTRDIKIIGKVLFNYQLEIEKILS